MRISHSDIDLAYIIERCSTHVIVFISAVINFFLKLDYVRKVLC